MNMLPEASICHGESSRSSTVFGLYDLVTTKLNTCHDIRMVSSTITSIHTVDKSIKLIFRDFDGWLGLTEQRNYSLARMSTNDWDDGF